MKKISFVLFLPMLVFVACEKNYGPDVTMSYPIVGMYDELEVSSAFSVAVSDSVSDVTITMANEMHKNVIVNVTDGELCIRLKPGSYRAYNGTAKVLLPSNAHLRKVDLSGASSFNGNLIGNSIEVDLSGASSFVGDLVGSEVDIDVSGASTVYSGNLVADELDVVCSGASVVTVARGTAGLVDLDLSGASTVSALGLESGAVDGDMSGGSQAEISCCQRIEVDLSGGSTLVYRPLPGCNPFVNCYVTGGSTVVPRQ